MAAAPLPLLAPLPPQFPTRFSDAEETTSAPEATADWPGEEEGAREGSASGSGGEREVVWQLKTAGEEHVQRLESRLEDLRAQPAPTLSDSGYASTSAAAASAYLDDGNEPDALSEAVEDDALAAGDEEEEGQALLSSTDAPAVVEPPRGRTRGRQGRTGASSSERDEDADTSDNDDEEGATRRRRAGLPHRLPPNVVQNTAQRISFSDSVRIGGRGRHRSHRHSRPEVFFPAPPTERTSLLLAPQPRLARPPSFRVASIASTSSSPSRSISPGPSSARARRPSLTSTAGHLSSSFPHLHSSIYSTSPASYGASRSSSPCSSVYAPLQPSSKFCPNPMYVRPTGGLRIPRRSGSALSFQDFLRAGGHVHPDDLDSDELELDEDDLDGAAEQARVEYRDLVAAQQLKRARWEARKRARAAQRRQAAHSSGGAGGGFFGLSSGGSFWDGLAQLLALGIAGSSSGRGTVAGSAAVPALPAPVTSSSSSSSRPSHLRRQSSLVSLPSSAFDSDSDSSLPPPRPSSRNYGALPSSSSSSRPSRPPKTESDVCFGPAPLRYLTYAWWRVQWRLLKRAAKRAWATALRGWRRAMQPVAVLALGHDEDDDREGYEEV
ncbi:hypothetical protein JCM8097_004897 [Rhodosporidiobolus ruineniae]